MCFPSKVNYKLIFVFWSLTVVVFRSLCLCLFARRARQMRGIPEVQQATFVSVAGIFGIYYQDMKTITSSMLDSPLEALLGAE